MKLLRMKYDFSKFADLSQVEQLQKYFNLKKAQVELGQKGKDSDGTYFEHSYYDEKTRTDWNKYSDLKEPLKLNANGMAFGLDGLYHLQTGKFPVFYIKRLEILWVWLNLQDRYMHNLLLGSGVILENGILKSVGERTFSESNKS